MKPLQVILPDIHKKTEKSDQKTRRKFFRGWPMRDTFTNWSKKNKTERQIKDTTSMNLYNNISINPSSSKKLLGEQSTCGITLE